MYMRCSVHANTSNKTHLQITIPLLYMYAWMRTTTLLQLRTHTYNSMSNICTTVYVYNQSIVSNELVYCTSTPVL